MKPVLFIILTLVTSIVFSQANEKKQDSSLYTFVEISHGVGPEWKPAPASKDSSVLSRPVYEFKVTKATDSVPAKLNTVFGLAFKVNGPDTYDLKYTIEWVYPVPMDEGDGKLYGGVRTNLSMATNKDNDAFFTFTQPYQLIKGKWKLRIYFGDKKVYAQTFIVY